MTTRRFFCATTYVMVAILGGCGPAVENSDTDSGGEDYTSTPPSTGTSGDCLGAAPDCGPSPGSCDDESYPAICQDGEWECAFAHLPPGDKFRCSTGDPDTDTTTSPTSADGSGSDSTGEPPEGGTVDVLFVVDNSANTAGLQRTLAEGAAGFLAGLEDAGVTDAHVMVTSTDMGNPNCSPFEPEGYDPLAGAPESTSCRGRLSWFDPASAGASQAEACTEVCAEGDTIDGPFLVLSEGQSNATGSAEGALACLIPQGIRGCGYEEPMESMLQALDPSACWNTPGGCSGSEEPFLREDAALLVVVLTDEGDCSIADYPAMAEPTYQSIDPNTGNPGLSSAWCFNAGIDCESGDTCVVREGGPLQSVARYADAIAELRASGKQVEIALLAGLDPGEEVRDWEAGDLFADEIDDGSTPEFVQYVFGPAPSCKDDERRLRALPTPRMQAALCSGDVPCHRASACETSYETTLQELTDQL